MCKIVVFMNMHSPYYIVCTVCTETVLNMEFGQELHDEYLSMLHNKYTYISSVFLIVIDYMNLVIAPCLPGCAPNMTCYCV